MWFVFFCLLLLLLDFILACLWHSCWDEIAFFWNGFFLVWSDTKDTKCFSDLWLRFPKKAEALFFVGLRSNPKEDTANSSWSLLRQNRKMFLFFLEICSNLEFPTYPMSKKLSEFRYVAFNGSACEKNLT